MQVSVTSNHNRNIGSRQTGDLSHNRRGFVPRNVDPRLIKNNVIFKDITIEEAYEDAFGDGIDVYNKKQKRKNRIKYDRKSYFEYLFKAKPAEKRAQRILTSNARGGNEINSFNEEIFQVSDCYKFGHFLRDSQGNLIDKNGNPIKWNDNKKKFYDINGNEVTDSSNLIPNPNAEVVKEILSVFYMGGRFKIVQDKNGVPSLKRLEEYETDENEIVIPSFEERNTNFKVIAAIMHNDEWHGTPHIHIDYVAVGEGYTKGPEKQVGFERALKNMGFEDKRTAYTEWREKERIILKQICGYYGLETKSKEEETSRGETYSTTVYRDAVREGMAEAQAIVEQAESEALSIKALAVTEAKNVTEQAKNDAEAEIQIAAKKSQQDAEEIKNKAVREAYATAERAQNDAKTIKKQADEYAQAIMDNALAEANNITNEAEQKAEELQAENKQLSDENEKIKRDTEQTKKQLVNLISSAAKFPNKKIFSHNMYTIDKETHDALMDALEYHIRLVNNTVTSDEDRQAAADERKRQEEITANMEQELQQRAIIEIQPYIKELEEEKKEYEKRREKADQTILNMVNRTANRMLSGYAKLSKEEKKKLLIPAYTAEKRELQKTDDFDILF